LSVLTGWYWNQQNNLCPRGRYCQIHQGGVHSSTTKCRSQGCDPKTSKGCYTVQDLY